MAEKMKIEKRLLYVLQPYEYNARRNDKAVHAVAESILKFGFKNPIIIDENDVIIAGHTRYKAAEELGLKEVPVIVAHGLTEEQVRAFRLADNRVAEVATWDQEKLRKELSEIEDDMTAFGFKADDDALKKEMSEFRHTCPKCGHKW